MISAQLVTASRRRVIDAAVSLAVGDITDPAAFEALCQAVTAHLEAARAQASTPAATVPFGPRKGAPLTVLSVRELDDLEQYLSRALRQVERKQFRSANLQLRGAVLAELHRRAPPMTSRAA